MKNNKIIKNINKTKAFIDDLFQDAEVIEEENKETNLELNPEEPVNYEQKCPVVIILDRSGSMGGNPINEANKGLQQFQTQILKDPTALSRIDLSVLSFGSETKVEREFDLLDQSDIPEIKVSGTTKMVDAVLKGIEILESRKKWYDATGQTRFRGIIILITDGHPDRDQKVNELREIISQGNAGGHFDFWAFGVKGADMNLLKSLGHRGSIIEMITGTEFVKLFKFVSASISKIVKSRPGDKLDLRPTEEDNPFQFTV